MSDCDRSLDYGIRNYPVCSGHGQCIHGQCICDAGWTGYTDLEYIHGYDCDVNLSSVKALAILVICLSSIALPIISYCMYKDSVFSHDKVFSAKTLCLVSFFSLNVFGLGFCFLKYIDPQNIVIGRYYALDICGLILTTSASTALSAYFSIVVKFLKSYATFLSPVLRKRLKSHLNQYLVLSPAFPIFAFVGFASTVFTAYAYPDNLGDKFCIGALIMYAVLYIAQASAVITVLRIFISELKTYLAPASASGSNGYSNTNDEEIGVVTRCDSITDVDPIQKVYDKVSMAYRLLLPVLGSGGPLNVLFASWFFVRRHAIIYLYFQLCLLTSLSVLLSVSLVTVKQLNNVGKPQIFPSSVVGVVNKYNIRRISIDMVDQVLVQSNLKIDK